MDNKKNNQLTSLFVNIIIPVIILSKFSKESYLGPVLGLIIALSFPLLYGLYELIIKKQKNFISIIGFIGILLSGAIGLLKFPPHWIAVKEAGVPLVIGIAVLISTGTSWQVIKKIFYSRELLDIDTIESKLSSNASQDGLQAILGRANILLACSFFFSSILNFVLARVIVNSMPGTVQFNEEIGRMAMLSYPIIALPSCIIMAFIIWYLVASLKKLTKLSSDELFAKKFKA